MGKFLSFLKRKPIIVFLICSIIFAFITNLINSTFLSFLYIGNSYSHPNYDSAFFYILGQQLLNGKTPYIDFYDHKGLFHIYVDAFGILLGGKTPLFILETLLLTFSSFFTLLSLKKIKAKLFAYSCSFVFIFILITICRQSNGEGMWVILFGPAILYLLISYFNENKLYQLIVATSLIGVEVGLSLNSRPSDLIVGSAFAIFVFIYFIIKKNAKNVFISIGCALGAFIVINLIFYIPALINGYAKEMFNAIFLSNLSYINTYQGSKERLDNIISIIIVNFIAFSCLFITYFKKEKDYMFYMFLITLICYTAFYIYIARYSSYYLSNVFYLGFMFGVLVDRLISLIFRNKLEKTRSFTLITFNFAYFIILNVVNLNSYYGPYNDYMSLEKGKVIEHNICLISEEERKIPDNVYMIDLNPISYLMGDVKPNFKYFAYQTWWSENNKQVKEDVSKYILEKQPTYIILGNDGDTSYYLESMTNYSKYVPEGYIENNEMNIYKRNNNIR